MSRLVSREARGILGGVLVGAESSALCLRLSPAAIVGDGSGLCQVSNS